MPFPQARTLASTSVVSLGNASTDNHSVGLIAFQVVGSAWTGSAVVKGRIQGAGIADGNLTSIPYYNVGTKSIVAAGTPITGDGNFRVQSNGLEIVLDYTHTSGSANVYPVPMDGPDTIYDSSGSSGSAVTIADGADVAEGTTTNAAITSDSNGTVIGFLRGLVKMWSDMWDQTNHAINVNLVVDSTPAPTSPLLVRVTDATNGTNTMPTSDVAARALYAHVTDGTNTAAVKAASTAAVAADPAAVVALSPNANIALNATPTLASTTALPVYAQLAVTNSTASQPITTPGRALVGGTGNTSLSVGCIRQNGAATWDPEQNNLGVSLLASAARTATQTPADIVNYNGRGLQVVLDMTNVGSSPSVTVTINGKDPASGKYYLLLSGAPIVTVSTNVYRVFPGATVTTNVSANDFVPRTFQIVVTANNANSGTYSVGYSLLT